MASARASSSWSGVSAGARPAVGQSEQPPGLARQLAERVGRLGQRVEVVQLPAEARPRLGGRPDALAADRRLERIGDVRGVQHPRRAEIFEQILGAALTQHAAGQRKHAVPERGLTERHSMTARDRDPVEIEHVPELRGGPIERTVDDHDLVPGHASLQERQHFGGDEFRLGALAAGLEQADRPVGFDRPRLGLE